MDVYSGRMTLHGHDWFLACAGVATAVAGPCIFALRARRYHFLAVDEGKAYRDGCRSMRQFLGACQRGAVKTVISLVGDDEIGRERFAPVLAKCSEMGMRLAHVPVHISSFPTSEDVRRFLEIATNPVNQPVLFHCREGIRRTGMMTAAYQMTVLGYTKEKTIAAIKTFGHSRRTVGDIERFIGGYDPATRSVSYPAKPDA